MYFQAFLTEQADRELPDLNFINTEITIEENEVIVCALSEEELYEALLPILKDNSPSPDGFGS